MSAQVEGFIPYGEAEPEQQEQPAKPTQVGYVSDEPKPTSIGYNPEEDEVEGYEQYTTPEIEEEKDNRALNAARWLFQAPLGVLQKFTWWSDVAMMIGAGDALDHEEIDRIAIIADRNNIPFDKDEYVAGVWDAMDLWPNQSNTERELERVTGLPFTPKNKGQQLLRLGFTGGAFQKGSVGRKAIAGATTVAATKASEVGIEKGLEAVGHDEETAKRVSEKVAPYVGLATGVTAGTLAPRVSIKTKPSGLTARRFEKIKGTTKVTPARKDAIKETLETDFRKIAGEIIEESPKAETFKEVIENPTVKAEATEGFKKVEELAGRINETVHTDKVKYHQLRRRQQQKRGPTPTEYDEAYDKYALDSINKTPAKAFTIKQYVNQYRKNNEALTGYFEPGASRNINRAKRDAILDHNRAITDMFEELFPDSEFTKSFKEQNQRWADIKDAEFIKDFIDDMFDGKINYKKAKSILDDKNTAFKFERFLGKEGYKKLKQLTKDFLEQEPFEKQLKVADSQNMGSAMREIAAWLIHPALGTLKTGAKLAKHAWHMLLDKPQLSVDWKAGIDAFKAGRFQEAEEIFEKLEDTVKAELETPAPPPAVIGKPPKQGETIDITPKPKQPKQITGPEGTKGLPAPRKIEALPAKVEPKKLTFKGKGGKYLTNDATVPYIKLKQNILEASPKNDFKNWGKLTKPEILKSIPEDARKLTAQGLHTLKDAWTHKWSNKHPRIKELKKNIIDYARDPNPLHQDYLADSIAQFKNYFEGKLSTTAKDLEPNFKLSRKIA